MSKHIVAGGIFKNEKGDEWFDLICPGPGQPPYVMGEDAICHFVLIWENVHLYRVEDDHSLSLVAPSPKALQWGVEAPERVWPDANLLEKIRSGIIRSHQLSPRRMRQGEAQS
jgi:hypothetical protein